MPLRTSGGAYTDAWLTFTRISTPGQCVRWWSGPGSRVPRGVRGSVRSSGHRGQAVTVTTLDPSMNEASHRWPAFLPDDRHFLYYTMGDKKGIYLASLDSKERTRIVEGGSNPLFVAPDLLLLVRERGLSLIHI